ncbi:hypothetical protein [Halostagnicola kamekurae]|uniref:Uncharacterized protein n=1 Tax=Halostagnicola kamekurae TaxID=619731 RepID=A0A1I6RFK1_9EURY|nr:hypothetical protein [Halostagnicola kamekurae]SFS63444.1 hypothetical protein SAMN04488556_1757 [Halostagnicola kamekurae]
MSTEADDTDVADTINSDTTEGTALPRSFLVEGAGPVTVVREHGDITERTEGEVSITRRLETLDEFAQFWRFRDLRNWKRNAIREVLESRENELLRYVIDDEQLEAWSVQVDGRVQAFVGVAETIVGGQIDPKSVTAADHRFESYLRNNTGKDADELTLEFAKDLKGSPLWGPGARLAELVVRHADREDLDGYVAALLEEVDE